MSYDIVYDRQFIKVRDKYIPIFLMGSNNCTQFHNGRAVAEKYWTSIGSSILYNENELKTFAKQFEEAEIFKTRYTRFKGNEFPNYMINGMSYAQPVEYFTKQYATVRVETYAKGEESQYHYPKTTQELEQIIELSKLANKKIFVGFQGREAKWTKQKNEPNNNVKKNGTYILKHRHNGYLVEKGDRTVKFSGNKSNALHFATKQEALDMFKDDMYYLRELTPVFVPNVSEKNKCYVFKGKGKNVYLSMMNGKISFYTDIRTAKYWLDLEEIKKAEKELRATLQGGSYPDFEIAAVDKKYVIPSSYYYVLQNGNTYLYKKTGNGYRYVGTASSAKKFKTEKEAQAYANKYNLGFIPVKINEEHFFD